MTKRIAYRAPVGQWGPWVEVGAHLQATSYLISATSAKATLPIEGLVRYVDTAERPATTLFSDTVNIVTGNTAGKVEVRFSCVYMPTEIVATVSSSAARKRSWLRILRAFSGRPGPHGREEPS